MNTIELFKYMIAQKSETPDDGGLLDFIENYLPGFEAVRVDVEDVNANLVSVYPNPSSGQFNLKDLLPGRYELQVFDGAGRTVLNKHFEKYLSEDCQFNLHHKGCYYLRLEQANGEVRFAKLLVN
mgnify:CR=1 FL=1